MTGEMFQNKKHKILLYTLIGVKFLTTERLCQIKILSKTVVKCIPLIQHLSKLYS